jgi:hypothetical protein
MECRMITNEGKKEAALCNLKRCAFTCRQATAVGVPFNDSFNS